MKMISFKSFYKKNGVAKLIIKRDCIDLYSKFVFLEESETKKEEFEETEAIEEEGDTESCVCDHDINCKYCTDQFSTNSFKRALWVWTY